MKEYYELVKLRGIAKDGIGNRIWDIQRLEGRYTKSVQEGYPAGDILGELGLQVSMLGHLVSVLGVYEARIVELGNRIFKGKIKDSGGVCMGDDE